MRNLSPLLFAAALAGCNLAPPHTTPPLPTAERYPADVDGTRLPAARATDLSWRAFFVDPRLEMLIAQGLDHNRDMRIAVAQIEEARGQYRIQNADRFPTIEGSANATISRSQGATGPEVTEFYQVGVGVTAFELDFWGRVRNLSEAARREYFATRQAALAFRLSLIRDIATAYFASREADEQIALAQATLTARQEELRIAKKRLDAGVTSALDYRQAESLTTQAARDLGALRLQKSQAENYLVLLVGGPVTVPLPAPLGLTQQQAPPTLLAGLPSDLLVARPDIVGAEERLRAARANVGAARAAFLPTISLTGLLGFASPALGSLFSGDSFTWSVSPSLLGPIFDFGRNQGNLTVAKARENIAVATYEKAIQVAFREVADALAGRRYIAEQIVAQVQGVEASRQIARLARLRYNEGVASYLEVLDAQRNLLAAEQQLITLRRAQLDNQAALYVALGGGRF